MTDTKPLEPNIWKETYIVRSYEIDANGNLSVPSIFNFIQNAASNHADALGVSVQQLLTEDVTWVLSRLYLKIDSYPHWKDQVQVYTWPSGIDGLFALRDFDLRDQTHRTFGACVTAWLIINTKKRRPVRMAPFVKRLNPIDGMHVLSEKLEKISPNNPQGGNFRDFKVGFRDLDLNQHVNSVRYIKWALDSVPETILRHQVLRSLKIDFVAETFSGDTVVAICRSSGGPDTVLSHHILKAETEIELARIQTMWRPIKDGRR